MSEVELYIKDIDKKFWKKVAEERRIHKHRKKNKGKAVKNG